VWFSNCLFSQQISQKYFSLFLPQNILDVVFTRKFQMYSKIRFQIPFFLLSGYQFSAINATLHHKQQQQQQQQQQQHCNNIL
jgi:hypothetical protein